MLLRRVEDKERRHEKMKRGANMETIEKKIYSTHLTTHPEGLNVAGEVVLISHMFWSVYASP